MSESNADRVKKIITEQLNVTDEQITPEASFIDDLGADSLDQVELVMALEEEFGQEIPEDEAEGELKEWYDRLRDPWGGVDDIMRIHSISLPTMKGHYELYKSAMTGNPDLSRKEREMIAIVVSSINQCHY